MDKSTVPRWAIAIGFGIASALVVLRVAVGPEGGWNDVSLSEWISVILGFLTGGWAKYSNPEKLFSPLPTIKDFPERR